MATSFPMSKRTRLSATLGLVTALLLVASVSAAVSVRTEPARPLMDVPFIATPGLSTDNTLYVSTSSSCGTATAVTSICTVGRSSSSNYNTTTCIFTVTSSALGVNPFTDRTVPQLYWCSSASGSTALSPFTLSKMEVSPPFVFFNSQTTLTFDAATPARTTVGFYSTDACSHPVSGTGTVTLGSSLTTDLIVSTSSGNTVYVCATVPTVLGTTVSVSATTVYASAEYDIFTTTGLRYTSVAVSTNSRAQYVSLSTSSDCLNLAQPATAATSAGSPVIFIQAPQGTYYFCTMIDTASGVYIPATSRFVVTEYGIQPRSIYAGVSTQMTLTRSAIVSGVSYDAGLFTDTDCTNAVVPWSSALTWSLSRTGTFYACVRPTLNPTAANTARAATVVVSGVPTLTYSRSPGIIGLGLVVTFTRNNDATGLVTVGIAEAPVSTGNACDNMIATGTTADDSATSVSLHVPENAPAQVVTCVSNPVQQSTDTGEETNTAYYYSMGTYNLRSYYLSFDPLLVQTDLAIALDTEVQFSSGTQMKLVPSSASGCAAKVSGSNTNSFQITPATSSVTPVRFPTAGDWLLCVSEPAVLDGEFGLLRTLQVYGDATVAPHGLVAAVPTSLSLSAIPPSASVYLTADAACLADGSNTKLASTTSSANAVATLQSVKHTAEANLTLCVSYQGERNSLATAGVVHKAGVVPVAAPQVYPSVVIERRTSKLSFLVPSTGLLVGGVAYLVPSAGGDIVCSTTTAPTDAAYQLGIAAGATAGDMPYANFTPVDSTVAGTRYAVCVGFTGGFAFAGTISVEKAMTMSHLPTTVAAGLPMRATFSGDAFTALHPDKFAVIDAAAECADDLTQTTVYAAGAIDSSGNTDYFLAPTTASAITICVAVSSSLVSTTAGYSEGGTVELFPFTALSDYALIGRTNDLQGWPGLGDAAALFLAPCGSAAACTAATATATCRTATEVFYTSSLQALPSTAKEGTYALCQQSTLDGFTSAVVGANTSVQVVPPWSLTTAASPIRQYQPFTVTLSGGPSQGSDAVSTYQLRVQPASTPCGSTPSGSSQTFAIPSTAGSTVITVTDIQPVVDVRFCLLPSTYDSFSVLEATLQSYMTPTVILADTPTVVTSATLPSNALAKLSSSAACADTVSNGIPQTIVDYETTFTVAGCGATNGALSTLHYCESTDGGASFASRGRMGLLRKSDCADGTGTASIAAATAAPATAITSFGVRSDFLTNPRLSTSAKCESSALLPANVTTLGYSPVLGGANAFYVCAAAVGTPDQPTFTTTATTFTVTRWAVTPTAVLSRYNTTIGALPSTRLSINYKTPSQQTFISPSRQCGSTLISASGLASSTALATTTISTTGVNGLLYVCTMDSLTPSRQIVVADFLSVTPPNVAAASPAIIRGATYSAKLLVQATGSASTPLYSMHQGTDSSYRYAPYYVSDARDVFLSTDSCGTVLSGTSVSYVNDDDVASFTTADIATSVSSVQLCTGTPAGDAVAMSRVVVAAGVVYPTVFVTGVKASIYIPLSPNTQFYLSQSSRAGDCGAVASTGLPSFTTDSGGYGDVILYTSGGATLAPTGTYNLCYTSTTTTSTAATGEYTALPTTIEVTPQSHFSVRGRIFYVGVPGSMFLLEDLKADYLLSGFATSRLCDVVDDTYGTWAATSSTSISVTASTPVDALYLCARSPTNDTISALPAAGTGSLAFQALGISLPANNTMNSCDSYTIGKCYAPGGSEAPADAVMGVIYGSCCSLSDRSHVVGQATMSIAGGSGGGTCELALDSGKVNAYSPATSFSLCAWSPSNDGYCATLGAITVDTDCTPSGARSTKKSLSAGELAAIIICSILGGLALIALIVWLIWFCCCRGGKTGADGDYIDMDSDVAKDKQLIALRHMEVGEYYDDGTSQSGSVRRHPLLYDPYGIDVTDSQSRTVSRSPRARSGSSGGNDPISLLTCMEEDQRDSMALTEARERYHLRLACSDGYAALVQAQKDDEVEIGFEREDDDDNAGDGYFARGAVPERRAVEDIDYEDENNTTTCVDVRVDADDDDDDEERDDSPRAAVDGAERRRLRSRSLESSRPSTPRRRESFMEEPERDGADGSTRRETNHLGQRIVRCDELHALKEEEVPHDLGTTPPRNLIIFHQTSRTSRDSGFGRVGGRTDDSGDAEEDTVEQPHGDDLHTSDNVPGGFVNTVPPARGDEDVRSPRNHHRVVARSLNMDDDKSLPRDGEHDTNATNDPVTSTEVSSIAAVDGPEDPSGAALPMGFAATRDGDDHLSDDDDDDALNYTTTQRYHDEMRVLLQNEDIRRQRLCNWEEEDRAAMALEELDLRLRFYEEQRGKAAATASPVTYLQGNGHYDNDEDDEDDEAEEEEYTAPAVPASLPPLPPAPRSRAAQQQYLAQPSLHTVDDGTTTGSDRREHDESNSTYRASLFQDGSPRRDMTANTDGSLAGTNPYSALNDTTGLPLPQSSSSGRALPHGGSNSNSNSNSNERSPSGSRYHDATGAEIDHDMPARVVVGRGGGEPSRYDEGESNSDLPYAAEAGSKALPSPERTGLGVRYGDSRDSNGAVSLDNDFTYY